MNTEITHLGSTQIVVTRPWGMNRRNGHRLLCSDGRIRAAELAETPDTFFSTPARCRVNGVWISGYMTAEELPWTEGAEMPLPRVFSFRPHDGQQGKHSLPAWAELSDDRLSEIISACHSMPVSIAA